MFLIVVTALISLLNVCVPLFVKSILACLCIESSHELSLQNTELQVKNEMACVSMVDEFAKHARLQRKLIKIQQELKSAANSRMSSYVKIKIILSYCSQIFIALTILCLIWIYKYTPVAVLPSHWMSPFGFVISWPTGVDGAISITFWLLVLGTALRTITGTVVA